MAMSPKRTSGPEWFLVCPGTIARPKGAANAYGFLPMSGSDHSDIKEGGQGRWPSLSEIRVQRQKPIVMEEINEPRESQDSPIRMLRAGCCADRRGKRKHRTPKHRIQIWRQLTNT
jgi:hypothetical protein